MTPNGYFRRHKVIHKFADGKLPGGRQMVSLVPTDGVAIYAGTDGVHLIDEHGATEFPLCELLGAMDHREFNDGNSIEHSAEILEANSRAFTPEWSSEETMLELQVA